MITDQLKQEIIEAIKAKDVEKLKNLQDRLKGVMWLEQFKGNMPISAWLEPNPFIKWK